MNLSISSISFQSRKPQIRKADDLMRKSKQAFPVFSPSRQDTLFRQLKNENRVKFLIPIIKHSKKLAHERQKMIHFYINKDLLNILNLIKKGKLGNCFEQSIALICLLGIKGYKNCKLSQVAYIIELTDKNTKEKVTEKDTIDHTFVTCEIDGKEVILDPWINKCGFRDDILTEYKHLFLKEIDNIEKSLLYPYSYIEENPFEISKKEIIIDSDEMINSEYLQNVDFNKIKKNFPILSD